MILYYVLVDSEVNVLPDVFRFTTEAAAKAFAATRPGARVVQKYVSIGT